MNGIPFTQTPPPQAMGGNMPSIAMALADMKRRKKLAQIEQRQMKGEDLTPEDIKWLITKGGERGHRAAQIATERSRAKKYMQPFYDSIKAGAPDVSLAMKLAGGDRKQAMEYMKMAQNVVLSEQQIADARRRMDAQDRSFDYRKEQDIKQFDYRKEQDIKQFDYRKEQGIKQFDYRKEQDIKQSANLALFQVAQRLQQGSLTPDQRRQMLDEMTREGLPLAPYRDRLFAAFGNFTDGDVEQVWTQAGFTGGYLEYQSGEDAPQGDTQMDMRQYVDKNLWQTRKGFAMSGPNEVEDEYAMARTSQELAKRWKAYSGDTRPNEVIAQEIMDIVVTNQEKEGGNSRAANLLDKVGDGGADPEEEASLLEKIKSDRKKKSDEERNRARLVLLKERLALATKRLRRAKQIKPSAWRGETHPSRRRNKAVAAAEAAVEELKQKILEAEKTVNQ